MFSCMHCTSVNKRGHSINKPGFAAHTYLRLAPTAHTTNNPSMLPVWQTERKPWGDSPEENGASTSCRFSIASGVPLGRRTLAHLALLEHCTDCNSRKDRSEKRRRELLARSCWRNGAVAAHFSRVSGSITGQFKRGELYSRQTYACPLARARTSSRLVRARYWQVDRDDPPSISRPPNSHAAPAGYVPKYAVPPLSRDSHLASRTSASPGRVSVSGGTCSGGAG